MADEPKSWNKHVIERRQRRLQRQRALVIAERHYALSRAALKAEEERLQELCRLPRRECVWQAVLNWLKL